MHEVVQEHLQSDGRINFRQKIFSHCKEKIYLQNTPLRSNMLTLKVKTLQPPPFSEKPRKKLLTATTT